MHMCEKAIKNEDDFGEYMEVCYKTLPIGYTFSTEFQTWIIGFCPDTNSFFVTNQRFWFWEYKDCEFESEQAGIQYFEDHIDEFIRVRNEIMVDMMGMKHEDSVRLDNTMKWYFDAYKKFENRVITD